MATSLGVTLGFMAEPFGWNAVVIGAWNRAILSPDGIARRLFGLPANTPVELEMAVDRPGNFRVAHEGLIVVPSANGLEVTSKEATPEFLLKACAICVRALQGLPETPVFAAGVNIRYRYPELSDRILDLIHAPLDNTLSDSDFKVTGSGTKRTLEVAPGVLNLQINQGPQGPPAPPGTTGTLEFNFHRDSTVTTELTEWLNKPREFLDFSSRILSVLGEQNVIPEVNK